MNRDLNQGQNLKDEDEFSSLNQNQNLSNTTCNISKSMYKNEKTSDEENSSFDQSIEMSLFSDESESRNRISAFSKVNFTKLSAAEKEERLKNLAKLIKRLRRKVRNLEKKFKQNASKTFNKFVTHSMTINNKRTDPKNKNNDRLLMKNKLNTSLEKLCRAMNNLRNCQTHEYEDQIYLIENLTNLIAEDRLPLDSIHFKKICTQVRLLLEEEKVRHTSSLEQKVVFSFPEKEVSITSKEYDLYSQFKDKEDVMRAILGVQTGAFKKQSNPQKINFNFSKSKSEINPNSPISAKIKMNKIESNNYLSNFQGNNVTYKSNNDNNNINNLNNINNISNTTSNQFTNVHNPANNFENFNNYMNPNFNSPQNQNQNLSIFINQLRSLNQNFNFNNLYAQPINMTGTQTQFQSPTPLVNPILVQYLQNIVNNNNINQNGK